jgi:two-component system CheB/CheR fusion protein
MGRPPSIASTDAAAAADRDAFPIVGIGASAGGLEALESLFAAIPAASGRAFVVVQHLDPHRDALLVQLLQRATSMPVVEITQGLRVAVDHVHVIPPNSDLSIRNGVLHLRPPSAGKGPRLPIDGFFESLAEYGHSRAIAVVLSGMGSDGALGIAAIKDRGGVVFVQSPDSAKFDAMPAHALATGLADAVASVQELATRIVEHRASAATEVAAPDSDASEDGAHGPEIDEICRLLLSETGQDFSHYKRNTVLRRIERRMGLHHLDTVTDYVRHLRGNPAETRLLFKELLIGVTAFFRDPPAWEAMRVALTALVTSRPAGVLRAWVAGCSTGEEAYSLAILFDEVLETLGPTPRRTVQIFATDLDPDAIERARLGHFAADIAADVSPDRLARHFRPDEQGYRVSQDIRERIIFAVQSVAMDPPFTKLDVVCCRNLLIYLAPDLQRQVLPLFHYGLGTGGLLFLGISETVGVVADAFETVDAKARIYRRTEHAASASSFGLRQTFKIREAREDSPNPSSGPNLQTAIERVLLGRHVPPLVVTTLQGDVLYVNGRTGRFLEPPAGKANWNIHALAREGLRHGLFAAFHRVAREGGVASLLGVSPDAGGAPVDVTIERMTEPPVLRDTLMITFVEPPTATVGSKRRTPRRTTPAIAALQHELLMAQQAMDSTRADMQTSSEHLQSANEELQSTNEELQSTNEELTTSKEEMQSLNEELQTVNAELQTKLDELSRSSDDMRNLLDSTDIATLFLDDTLRVRRFTPKVLNLIKLLPSDVNRPITDLASDLVYPQLVEDARAVLRTLVFRQTEIATVDDRWFSVRIMPYRTLSNRIDGVVITFVDISAAKGLEAELRRERATREAQPG